MAVVIQASAEYFGQWCQREARRHHQNAEQASNGEDYQRARTERMVSSALYAAAAEWQRYQRMGASYTPSAPPDID